MIKISFKCPQCGKEINFLDEEMINKIVKCKKCKWEIFFKDGSVLFEAGISAYYTGMRSMDIVHKKGLLAFIRRLFSKNNVF